MLPDVSNKFVFGLKLTQFFSEVVSNCDSIFTQLVFLDCIQNSENNSTRHWIATVLQSFHTPHRYYRYCWLHLTHDN